MLNASVTIFDKSGKRIGNIPTPESDLPQKENFELIIPVLKIILITASRLKNATQKKQLQFTENVTPFVLRKLKKVIEENFKSKHSASDYATLLNISPYALAKLVKALLIKRLRSLLPKE